MFIYNFLLFLIPRRGITVSKDKMLFQIFDIHCQHCLLGILGLFIILPAVHGNASLPQVNHITLNSKKYLLMIGNKRYLIFHLVLLQLRGGQLIDHPILILKVSVPLADLGNLS